MPEIPFRYIFVSQSLTTGNDLCSLLAEPSISRMVENDLAPSAAIIDKTSEILAQSKPFSHIEYTFPKQVTAADTEIRVDAPDKSEYWKSSFQFPVHYVWWQVDSRYKIAFVPGIGVHAIAVGAGEIENEVRREVKNVLTRTHATTRLAVLNDLSRFGPLKVVEHNEIISVPTPREVADKSSSQDKKQSILKSIGRQLKQNPLRAAWLVDQQVKQLAEKLAGRQPESVLLVGPSGVGKTAIFEQLVRTANTHEMGEFQFWQTDGSRLIAGMSGFGQWQQRCTDLVNELDKKKAIIHFGNLVELIETGKGGSIQQGIADFLRPFLIRGKITAVTECTEEQLSVVAKQSPQMLDAFHQIRISPLDAKRTGEVLLEIAANEMGHSRITIEPSAIAAINQLHARYATYSAMPGRAVRFFRNLAEDTTPGQTIDADAVTDAFANETGLPKFLLRDSEPLDLKKAHDWFSQRIIGQTDPVDLVVDLLAVVKSSLNRPGRPIASLMFIGPTGVGKTQMAKALAEFMYRDEKKMVRFDMSEYKDAFSAARLIGGMGKGDGLLTSKVRENPFTVVLLDEFEKAHSGVFDLFLQVLGEGRLTDGHGRLVDFSTCVIIITSNLGVESFREVSLGFGDADNKQAGYQEHFVRKVQQHVRPEFFNRIDRIVPFSPLEMDAVEKIAERELELVKLRYGIANRQVDFKIHKSASPALAKLGYDPRYGARPLKRAINQRLVQPLARQLIQKPVNTPIVVSIHAQKTGIHFSIDAPERNRAEEKLRHSAQTVIFNLSRTRRRSQALAFSPSVNRLRNEIYRKQQSLDRALRRHDPKIRDEKLYSNPELLKRKTRIDLKTDLIDRVERQLDNLLQYEQRIVQQLLNRQDIPLKPIQEKTAASNKVIERLILELFLDETDSSKQITLTTYSRHDEQMQILMRAWIKVADQYEFNHELFQLRRHVELDEHQEPKPIYMLPYIEGSENYPGNAVDVFRHTLTDEPEERHKDLLGYSIVISGEGAFQIFMPEQGVHRFRENKYRDVLVVGDGRHVKDTIPPDGIERLPSFEEVDKRRTIDLDAKSIRDKLAGTHHYQKSELITELAKITNECFHQLLNERIQTWN